jgi:hypothetical protein
MATMRVRNSFDGARPPKPPYRFGDTRPRALDRLRGRRQWVAWDYAWVEKKRKWDKPPRNAHTGKSASINNPFDMGTFDVAVATARRLELAGVGFVLRADDNLTGIDLDHCVTDSGSLSPLAAEVIEYGETYAEYSPSGEGIRIWALGKVESTTKHDAAGVEVYGAGRYLTVTGNQVEGTPDEIREAPRTIARLLEAVAISRGETPQAKATANGHAKPAGEDFWSKVNAAALANRDAWVPVLHPKARKQATGALRVSSRDLGRDREEDISYHADGIQDFGDEYGLTPIDAVRRFGDACDAADAALWLCRHLGVEPASLGWRGRETPPRSEARANVNDHAPLQPSQATEREWPDPVALPTGLLSVAPFDYGMLPEKIRARVEDIAERMQCPPDYVGVSSMVALGSVIGRKVAVRPKREDDWSEVANQWGLIIGAPGLLKTPAQNEALSPLRALEAAARQQFALAKAEYDAQQQIAELRTKAAKEEAKAKLAKEKTADVSGLLKHETIAVPVRRRYITINATTEALGEILKDNPNGVVNVRDEAMAQLQKLDEEGQSEARGFLLQAWSGVTDYNFDRIGRGLDNYIPAVCLSMVGGTQPAKISQYIAQIRRGNRGNDGLIQRFGLMVWPDISPEWINVDRYPKVMARDMATAVFERLDVLDASAIGAHQDRIGDKEVGLPYLRLAPAAQELFLEWRRGLERRLRSGENDPMMEGHLAKYRKLVPSLALIIHLADADVTTAVGEVSVDAVQKALRWAAYLETHAARVYGSGDAALVTAANAIIAKVKSGHLKEQFGSRDVWRPQWSLLRDRDTVHAALKMLADYDWLRIHKAETDGRTATVYAMNPKVLTQEKRPGG